MALNSSSALRFAVLVLGYFISGILGLELAIIGSNITLIWLPTGIAVAALFRWGQCYWTAVWLAALAVNLWAGSPFLIASGIAVGNTLGPVLVVALLHRWHFRFDISRRRDMPLLIVSSALGMLVSATGGVAVLAAGGFLARADIGTAWLAWWLGDAVGVIVGGIALLTFQPAELLRLLHSDKRFELFASVSVVGAIGLTWFSISAYPSASIILAPLAMLSLVWIAQRLGSWPAAVVALALSACAALALATGQGPFQNANLPLAIAELWAYMLTISSVAMLVSALNAERCQAEALFHGLFDQSSFLGVILDQQGRLIEINSSAMKHISIPRIEVIGKYFPDTPWWDNRLDREKLLAALTRAFNKTPSNFETTHRTPSGETINVMFSAMPVVIEDGVYVSLIGIDITERKRTETALHNSEQRFRDFFEHNSSVMLLIEPISGEINDANMAAASYYGYPRAQLIGMSIDNINILPPERVADERRFAFREQRNYFNFPHRLASGEVRDVEVHSTPIESEGRPLLFSIIHDITARHYAEAELLRSNAELEQFSYSVSHDMRQPLRMISSYMQLLERNLGDRLDPQSQEFFNIAIGAARRMDEMMLGLLDYSRIGNNGEPHVWIESSTVLAETMLFLQPVVAESHAEILIDGVWPRALVRRDEMQRLLQNLIGNALKFRIAGHPPKVAISSEVIGPAWRVSVADNGIGISTDQLGKLFKVFQRLRSHSDYEGTGIGLALCRKIAVHHGGKIWVTSPGEGLGSCFHLEIPLPVEETGETQAGLGLLQNIQSLIPK